MSESTAHPDDPADDDYYRRAERAWQNEVGVTLLDGPHDTLGSAAVFARQFRRVLDAIDAARGGVLLEVGCGKGHFLEFVRAATGGKPALVGLDLSRAAHSLPAKGLLAVQGDGEALPFRDESVTTIVYDGALHHLIDYPAALRDAVRTLAPGGRLVLFEPVSSRFSRVVHRLLDPLVFRKVVYESPIDIRYKARFSEARILETLRDLGLACEFQRSDFLAYPLTGCYAGSAFGKSDRLMRLLFRVEDTAMRLPGLRRLAGVFSWRFLIVAHKRDTESLASGRRRDGLHDARGSG